MKTALKTIAFAAVAVIAVFVIIIRTGLVDPELYLPFFNKAKADVRSMETVESFLGLIKAGDYESAAVLTDSYDQTGAVLTGEPGKLAKEAFGFDSPILIAKTEDRFTYCVNITWLDFADMLSGFKDGVRLSLNDAVANASSSREIYTEELKYRPEVLEASCDEALQKLYDESADHSVSQQTEIEIIRSGKEYKVRMNADLYNIISNGRASADTDGAEVFRSLCSLEEYLYGVTGDIEESVEYVRFNYIVPPEPAPGFLPDAENYGTAAGPEEIEQLLGRPYAAQLTQGRNMVWSPELNFIDKSEIKYYLDETILALVWNEPIGKTWGTFCEVVVSDPSQFRRKIVNDTFDCDTYKYPYELAAETNSVAAATADLYDHWSREIGICVYQGEVLRFVPKGDVCFVTESGDFIMRASESFESIEEAQKFVDENSISFSMCFGPITVQNGEDVSPQYYKYGEIYDEYPRIMISQIDELHYLIVTSNQNPYRPEYSKWGCELSLMTETMLSHGCPNAYTLDGGQTGAIMLNGEMQNPMQYKGQQIVSDIIYFATAVPPQ